MSEVRDSLTANDSHWNQKTKEKLLDEYDHWREDNIKLRKELEVMKEALKNIKPEVTPASSSTNATRKVFVEDERGYKLDPNTPTYSGKENENFEKWRYLINNA